jgi:hypothetical protein
MFVAAPVTMTASPGSTPTPPTLLTTWATGRAVSTFEECTGLALPDGAGVRRGVTSSSSGSSGDTKECLLSLTVPGGFGAFLEANFKKATWQEVSPALTGPQVRSHRTWAIRDIEGAAYYTLTHSGGGDGAAGGAAGAEATETWTTSVAYDAKTGQAYVVGVRTKAGK